ncbi:MAG: anti-sigma factor antagonist [Clostridia bacterium]|jgi:stage II sporulation protein AA (anti-sigma F factor antagonist)|nr:anti-sigma factor antagonist [Clostridia bacterium]
MKQAQIICECEGDILSIAIKGEIDHHSAKSIREQMDTEIFCHRKPKVILDLSGIDFMDSSGLGLILGRYTKIKDLGAVLILKDPTQEIIKILKLAGVDKLIKIKTTKEGKHRSLNVREGRSFNDEKNVAE